MHRGEAVLKAKPSKLALATSSVSAPAPYLTVVSRGETAVPTSVAPVATAAALQEEAVDVAVGGDWPSRPEGVSEEVLYNEWLRAHTPTASVSTQKKMADGSFKRKPHRVSNIHRPKAIALGVGVTRTDCYVIPIREYVERINSASTSRYKKGASPVVKDFINPKAEKYIMDCHIHRALVWKEVARAINRKSLTDHESYDFKDRIEARRLEQYDDPSRFDTSGTLWEQAVSDASVAANDDDFVGPLMLCPVPDGKDHNTYFVSSEEAELLMWSVREHDYQLRQRELEQVFAVEAKAPVVTPPTEEPRPLASVSKWRSKLENFYLMRHKGMLMGDSFTREMRELCKDWNEVTGWSHRQMKSRVTQYQYMLRSMAERSSASEYQQVSTDTFWKMFREGHSLPGEGHDMNTYFQPNAAAESSMLRARFHDYKLRKAELTETFRAHVDDPVLVKKPSTPADEVLCRLYDRLVADARKAKAEIKSLVVAAKVQFAGTEFVQTETGLLLPAVMLDAQREMALEPRW